MIGYNQWLELMNRARLLYGVSFFYTEHTKIGSRNLEPAGQIHRPDEP